MSRSVYQTRRDVTGILLQSALGTVHTTPKVEHVLTNTREKQFPVYSNHNFGFPITHLMLKWHCI